jgi:putative membrane protein
LSGEIIKVDVGMARSLWVALAGLTMAALAGCAVPPPSTAPSPPASEAPAPAAEAAPAPPAAPRVSSDQDFLNQAAGLNAREIGMGRLARGKGAAKEIRLFAAHLALEHIELNKRLEVLAKHLQLDIVPPPDRPPPALLMTIGPNFDRHYLDLVIKGHQDMIALYEAEETSGQDPRAKAFAREALPALRQHLKEGQSIVSKTGV